MRGPDFQTMTVEGWCSDLSLNRGREEGILVIASPKGEEAVRRWSRVLSGSGEDDGQAQMQIVVPKLRCDAFRIFRQCMMQPQHPQPGSPDVARSPDAPKLSPILSEFFWP